MPHVRVAFTKASPFQRPLGSGGTASELRLARIFRDAVVKLSEGANLQEIVGAISRGDVVRLQALFQWDSFADELAKMADVLHGAYLSAATKSSAVFGITFDDVSLTAIQWARANAGELLVEVTTKQAETVRQLITRALTVGGHPSQVAKDVKQVVGLHSKWANAVVNHRAKLEAQGVKQSIVDRAVRRYAARLVRARAVNIARTEILRASNQGRLQSWRNAANQGLFKRADVAKEWATGADACPACEPLDGARVAMEATFTGTFGFTDMPPAHPGCRCTAFLVDLSGGYLDGL